MLAICLVTAASSDSAVLGPAVLLSLQEGFVLTTQLRLLMPCICCRYGGGGGAAPSVEHSIHTN